MSTESTRVGHFRRVLTVWDLILYGLVAVTPSAPATVFGLAELRSHGHAVVTILFAMVAMVLTAISYGRMASLYPSAGSAYTYVGRGLHPYLGFVAGWAMLLDYIVSPLFCVMYGTLCLQRVLPNLPFFVGTALFAAVMTFPNLRGIRSTARANEIILAFMFTVLLAYIGMAIHFIILNHGLMGLFSMRPFYSPGTFNLHDIGGATSFAALTYLGFDAVTTLAEDVRNPRRSVMQAAVAVCVFTGIFGGLLVYLAQIAWPDYLTYPNIETAFMDVMRRVGGSWLFHAMAALLVVAYLGAGMTTQVGAARLMFGMGRDNLIPRRFFAHLHPVRNTPNRNIWLIGALSYAGALAMGYETTAELLNFGAFLGFMGVNLAVIREFWFRRRHGHLRSILADVVLPLLGFVFCTAIWMGLATPAKIAGAVWFFIGLGILTFHTRGFRQELVFLDLASMEEGAPTCG